MKEWAKRIIIIALWGALLYAVIHIGSVVYKSGQYRTSLDDTIINLEKLKSDGEYQYEEIAWGFSFEEVNKVLPYPIVDAEYDGVTNASYKYDQGYSTPNNFVLDEQYCIPIFRFRDGLYMIQFAFRIDENGREWFDRQVAELTRLYGEANDKIEWTDKDKASADNCIGYRWDAENSSLQIVYQWGGGVVYPTVALTIGSLSETDEAK